MSWTLSAFADESASNTDGQIEALKQAGISHIDPRNVDGHNIAALPVDLAKEVAEKYAAAGIKVGMFGSPIGKITLLDDVQDDLDRLKHLAKLSPIFGTNEVRIFSYYKGEGNDVSDADFRKESISRLKQLKALAADSGMVLYHENERGIFGERCADIEAIADALHDGETFKLIFDFDNYNQAGDDVWDNWLKLRSRTDAFHLKDSDKNNQHMPLGQGNGQAKKILADALERGWSGPLSLEPHLKRSPAIMATGPSGQANQALKDMTPEEVFQFAAQIAKALLSDIKAPVV